MTDLLIIGAGPAGLACAIEAANNGLSSLILEKGSVADAVRRFPTNMVFFSTPELLEIGGVPFIISTMRPTRVDAVRYYQRVAAQLRLPVKPATAALAIEKRSGAFRVRTNSGEFESKYVVDATGYFDDPNPFPVPGADLPKVLRYYTEPYEYAGREVAIVGGKNSAVDAALELFRNGVKVTIIHRGPAFSDGVKYWMLPDIENRRKAGEVRVLFETTVAEVRENSLVLSGEHAGEIANDILFPLIGYTPTRALLKSAGVRVNPETLGPVHDPATFETNVEGLFVAGSIAAGRLNNRIFIENGRLHGASVVRAILKK